MSPQKESTCHNLADMAVGSRTVEYNPQFKKRLSLRRMMFVFMFHRQADIYMKNSRSNQQDRLSSGRQLTDAELKDLKRTTFSVSP